MNIVCWCMQTSSALVGTWIVHEMYRTVAMYQAPVNINAHLWT